MTKDEETMLRYRLAALFDVRDRDVKGNVLAKLAKLAWLYEEIDKLRALLPGETER